VHVDNLNLNLNPNTKPTIRRAISPLKPNQCSLQTLEKHIAEEKAKPTPFTDELFPPHFSIIFNKKYGSIEEGLTLERLSAIYEGAQLRMIKNCEPTLLSPGKYTSPALHCALGILSEEPGRVVSLIGSQ
jgi:hypothetical protein